MLIHAGTRCFIQAGFSCVLLPQASQFTRHPWTRLFDFLVCFLIKRAVGRFCLSRPTSALFSALTRKTCTSTVFESYPLQMTADFPPFVHGLPCLSFSLTGNPSRGHRRQVIVFAYGPRKMYREHPLTRLNFPLTMPSTPPAARHVKVKQDPEPARLISSQYNFYGQYPKRTTAWGLVFFRRLLTPTMCPPLTFYVFFIALYPSYPRHLHFFFDLS